MYQCSHLHEWCSAYLHKTNVGVKTNLLQELKNLSRDLRKNRKLIFFSAGWAKKKIHRPDFRKQTYFFFWPKIVWEMSLRR